MWLEVLLFFLVIDEEPKMVQLSLLIDNLFLCNSCRGWSLEVN